MTTHCSRQMSLCKVDIQGMGIHHRFTFASSRGSVGRLAPAAATAPVAVPDESLPRVAQSLEQPVASSTSISIVDSDIECDLPPRTDTLGAGAVCKIQSRCVPHCSCRSRAGMWYVLAGANHVSGSSSGCQVLQRLATAHWCKLRMSEVLQWSKQW